MHSRHVTPDERGSARAPSRRVAMRVIQNGLQMMAVFEMDPVRPGEARALVFEATDSWIRIDDFPADWHRLPDDELLALRGRRE